jgi:hypothetical protein
VCLKKEEGKIALVETGNGHGTALVSTAVARFHVCNQPLHISYTNNWYLICRQGAARFSSPQQRLSGSNGIAV